MYSGSSNNGFGLAFDVFVLIWIVGGAIYANYRRRNRSPEAANTSVLMSYYTDGTIVEPIKKGNIGDLHYSAMLAINFSDLNVGNQTALLYCVELPFSTTIHLVGIPKKTGAVQLDPTHGKSIMERVELEGDYNKYFDLFCEKGMQEDARYVLNPKAMLFTLDFCQSQNWEIVGNELYFVLASGMKVDENDPTSLQDDITKFVSEIRPAIAKPLTDKEKAEQTPYGEDRRTNLKCPLCGSLLANEEHYFSCPKGDGVLLNGAELQQVKQGSLSLPASDVQPVKRDTDIKCPSCGNQMSRVAYDGGSTMIDSCTNCPYRWLDAGEYKPLPNLMS